MNTFSSLITPRERNVPWISLGTSHRCSNGRCHTKPGEFSRSMWVSSTQTAQWAHLVCATSARQIARDFVSPSVMVCFMTRGATCATRAEASQRLGPTIVGALSS